MSPNMREPAPSAADWPAPIRRLTRGASRRAASVAAIAYALIVASMWGAFNPLSGFSSETIFPYTSETSSWHLGFFFRDTLRAHTNTFYHLSYLIGEALGIGGSYTPFQAVYALLWWSRGFLVFLILRRFLPDALVPSFAAGALVLVHASDRSLQWVGQMNQFGFIFWMLLAAYCVTAAVQTVDRSRATALALAGCFCECMCLWSYESPIFLVLAFPLALPLLHGGNPRRRAAISALWYAPVALYLVETVARYARGTGRTYQEGVLRKSWDLAVLAGDWWFNVGASLAFWTWARTEWRALAGRAEWLSGVAVIAFLLGGIAMVRIGGLPGRLGRSDRGWWMLLAVGLSSVALSIPPYLLLGETRSLWRTQLLSGIGAGLALTAVIGLLATIAPRRRVGTAAFLVLGSVVVYLGSAAAIERGALHRFIWERHRAAIAEILRVAPSLRPTSVVVVVGIPRDADPFGHAMWLDLALRLVYPHIPVAGVYFYSDGTPGPGTNLKASGNTWKWDGTGFPPVVREAALSHTIVVLYDAGGSGKLARVLPSFVCAAPCAAQTYDPAPMIGGPISPRAVRRYRLDAGS
jgi:hypothetical protein